MIVIITNVNFIYFDVLYLNQQNCKLDSQFFFVLNEISETVEDDRLITLPCGLRGGIHLLYLGAVR